jgi:hypothetical protein
MQIRVTELSWKSAALRNVRKCCLRLAGDTAASSLNGMQASGAPCDAGQAVVQFAKHSVSEEEFAIKFFLFKSAFREERAQYTDRSRPLWHFLPKARAIFDNEDGSFVDAWDSPMPPCIVMEKGESLDQWVKRNTREMDPFTCMQVRCDAAHGNHVCMHARTQAHDGCG